MPAYYTNQNHSGIAAFKELKKEYVPFKDEYISVIDAVISFYVKNSLSKNENKKEIVKNGLENFKKKLFNDTFARNLEIKFSDSVNEQLNFLFASKENMESIKASLEPAEGAVPFTENEINQKLLTIYNLAKNPTAELLLSRQWSSSNDLIQEIDKMGGPEKLFSESKYTPEQTRKFFSILMDDVLSFDTALDYVSRHGSWFKKLVKRHGENPLLALMLEKWPTRQEQMQAFKTKWARVNHHELLLYKGVTENAIKQAEAFDTKVKEFFLNLDGGPFSPGNALGYVDQNQAWFKNLVKGLNKNPLLTIVTDKFLTKALTLQNLNNITSAEQHSLFYRSSKDQCIDFFSAMYRNNTVDEIVGYLSNHAEWFKDLYYRFEENTLDTALKNISKELKQDPTAFEKLLSDAKNIWKELKPIRTLSQIIFDNTFGDDSGVGGSDLPPDLPDDCTMMNAAVPADDRAVDQWASPEFIATKNPHTATQYKKQYIIQLEDDPDVRKAAARLAGKHPEITCLAQSDQNGNFHLFKIATSAEGKAYWKKFLAEDLKQEHKELKKLFDLKKERNAPEEKIRWQFVGHGRDAQGETGELNNVTMGGRTATLMAANMQQFYEYLGYAPDHVNMVGCALVNNFARTLMQNLSLNLRSATLAFREESVGVNNQGRKITPEGSQYKGGKRIYYYDDGVVKSRAAVLTDSEASEAREIEEFLGGNSLTRNISPPLFPEYEISEPHQLAISEMTEMHPAERAFHPEYCWEKTPELDEFFEKRTRLQTDAAHYFKQLNQSGQTLLPERVNLLTQISQLSAAEGMSQPELIEHIMPLTQGVVLGEAHSDIGSKQFLIDNMAEFYQKGVRTLYMEHLLSDIHQRSLDEYFAAPGSDMPDLLKRYLTRQNKGHFFLKDSDPKYNFLTVVEAARQAGIKIVAIDSTTSYQQAGITENDTGTTRNEMMNYFAEKVIRHYQSLPDSGKWVALVGNSHMNTFQNVYGLAELTGTLGLRITDGVEDKVASTDPGVSAGREYNDWIIKGDLLLTVKFEKKIKELFKKLFKAQMSDIERQLSQQIDNLQGMPHLNEIDTYATVPMKYKGKTYKELLRSLKWFWMVAPNERFEVIVDLCELSAQYLAKHRNDFSFFSRNEKIRALKSNLDKVASAGLIILAEISEEIITTELKLLRERLTSLYPLVLPDREQNDYDGPHPDGVRNDATLATWTLPDTVQSNAGSNSDTDYTIQLIIQLEDEVVVRRAAAALAGKHPERTLLVQLDTEGHYRVLKIEDGLWAPSKDSAKSLKAAFSGIGVDDKVRWQLVGHGRTASGETGALNNSTMGDLNSALLATNLQKIYEAVGHRAPNHISLVGCTLTDKNDAPDSFAASLMEELSRYMEVESLTARSESLGVDEQGRKITLGDSSHKVGKVRFYYENRFLKHQSVVFADSEAADISHGIPDALPVSEAAAKKAALYPLGNSPIRKMNNSEISDVFSDFYNALKDSNIQQIIPENQGLFSELVQNIIEACTPLRLQLSAMREPKKITVTLKGEAFTLEENWNTKKLQPEVTIEWKKSKASISMPLATLKAHLQIDKWQHADLYDLLVDTDTLENLMHDINWQDADLRDANLINKIRNNLSGPDLSGADLTGVNLTDVNLSGFSLAATNFTEANLTGANLSTTNLIGASFSRANLTHANLTDTELTGANCTDANLSGTDFSRADLTGANLRRANFTDATLIAADFTGATFSHANLTGANFTDAIFLSANLTGVNLTNATFEQVDISRANFTDANLSGVRMTLRLPKRWNEHNLDYYLHHRANNSSLISAINSIGPHFRELKVSLMQQLLTTIDGHVLNLQPIMESLIDCMQPDYMANQTIAYLMEQNVIQPLIQLASEGPWRTENKALSQSLLTWLNKKTEADFETFVEKNNSFFIQLIHNSRKAGGGVKKQAEALYEQKYLPLERISPSYTGADRFFGNYENGERTPDWSDKAANNYILTADRAVQEDGHQVIEKQTLLLSENQLNTMLEGTAEHWEYFTHYIANDKEAPRALPIGDLGQLFREHFKMFAAPYAAIQGQTNLIELLKLLELGDYYQMFVDALKSGRTGIDLTAMETQANLEEIFSRVLFVKVLQQHDSAQSEWPPLTPEHSQQIINTFALTEAATEVRAQNLVALAAIFTRYSSSSVFGTEGDSPVALRRYAYALLSEAERLAPELFNITNRHSAQVNVLQNWKERLRGENGEFTCTAVLYSIIMRYINDNHFTDVINRLLPPAWRQSHLGGSASESVRNRSVTDWQLPLPAVNNQSGGETRYEQQLIIQLEDDIAVNEAALMLAEKHPESSFLLQMDKNGDFRAFKRAISPDGSASWEDLSKEALTTLLQKSPQAPTEKVRWQLVGHGRTAGGETGELNNSTLAGLDAVTLAANLEKLARALTRPGETRHTPDYISLAGCALTTTATPKESFAGVLAAELLRRGITNELSARTALIRVNEQGRKLSAAEASKTAKIIFYRGEGGVAYHYVAPTERTDIYADRADLARHQAIEQRQESAVQREISLLAAINRAEDFQQAMQELMGNTSLTGESLPLPAGEWLPVLGSLKKDDALSENHTLQFINPAAPELPPHTLTTNDRRIIDFVKNYNENLDVIRNTFDATAGKFTPKAGITEAEAVHGLNSAFLIKTLIPWFADKKRAAASADPNVPADPLPATLDTALRVHTWVNLTQMAQGALDDGAKFIRLCQLAASEGRDVTSSLLSPLSRLSSTAGVGLNVASMVLDSVELAHAQNEAQRAVFGTQLTFDTAGLVTTGVGLGAGYLGASTVAAFSGALSVPLAGLGIGFTALAEAFGKIASEAEAVGRYFADLDAAWRQGGYRQAEKIASDGSRYQVTEAIPGAVINKLDLKNGTLTFGSPCLYRNKTEKRVGSGHDNAFAWWPDGSTNPDKTQAINIRKGLGYSEEAVSFAPGDSDILVLPVTPVSYIDYEYMILPFATWRKDRGFDLLRRLEESEKFDFDFYAFPSERIINRIMPDFVDTKVEVILDDRDRSIVIPSLPEIIHGKLSYDLTGGSGTYHISLQEGVFLSLQGDNSETRWVLDARNISDADNATIEDKKLHTGNITITLPEVPCSISLINNSGVFSFAQNEAHEWQKQEVVTNANAFKNLQGLHDHLRQLSNAEHHKTPFVAVEDYLPSPQSGPVGRAFYETGRDRFIYTNRPDKADFLSQATLAKVEGDKAWFCQGETLWQVDITSGEILTEYLPMKSDIRTVSSYVMQRDNQLLFVLEALGDEGPVSYTYQVEEAALKLVAVDGHTDLLSYIDGITEKVLSEMTHPSDPEGNIAPNDWVTGILSAPEHQIKGSMAKVVSYSGQTEGVTKHYWMKIDGKRITDLIKMNRIDADQEDADILAALKEKNPQQPALLSDFTLAFITDGDQPGYYFYSHQRQRLYFQPGNGLSEQKAHMVRKDIRSLFFTSSQTSNQQLIALTDDGTLWLADNQGTLRLTGVTAAWLQPHRENLTAALRQLARDNPARFSTLLLQGVKERNGKPVTAWYDSVADCIVPGGANLPAGDNLTCHGLSTDRTQAWIFDSDSQQLYRQPLAAQTAMTFNEKTLNEKTFSEKTLSEKTLSKNGVLSAEIFAAEPWPQADQKYQSVIRQGDKLQLKTADGALLLLSADAGMSDRPLLIAWDVQDRTEDDIVSAIASLKNNAELPPAVRLIAKPGQPAAWYLPAEEKVLRAATLNADHSLHYLGQVAGQQASYVHDQTTGALWSVSDTTATPAGKFTFANLTQNGVVLQRDDSAPRGEKIRLPILAGSDHLAITGRSEEAYYWFNEPERLAHYRYITIDDRGKHSVIRFSDSSIADLSLQRNGQDLILSCKSALSDTHIRFVNIKEAAERGMNLEIGSLNKFRISDLLQSMDEFPNTLQFEFLQTEGSLTIEPAPRKGEKDLSPGESEQESHEHLEEKKELLVSSQNLPKNNEMLAQSMATFTSSEGIQGSGQLSQSSRPLPADHRVLIQQLQ